jgi:hypothetical protein
MIIGRNTNIRVQTLIITLKLVFKTHDLLDILPQEHS